MSGETRSLHNTRATRPAPFDRVDPPDPSVRLDRLSHALDGAILDDGREAGLRSILAGALEVSGASRGYAIYMDGDTVAAECSATAEGSAYLVDEETRKLAARAAVKLTASATENTSRAFAIELHGAKAGVSVVAGGRSAIGILLDRPDADSDPGMQWTAGFMLAVAGLHRRQSGVAGSDARAGATKARKPGREAAAAAGGVGAVAFLKTVDELERDAIELALRECNWKKDEAAKRIGISRASMYVKAKRFGLQNPPRK